MGEIPKQSSAQQIKARWGGLLLVVGAVQFVLAMTIVQLAYPGYSDVMNNVSDLGNPNLSSLAWLYNASIAVSGITGLLATPLIISTLPKRIMRLVGLGFFAIGNLGLILVGIFPENTTILGGFAHSLAGQLAFPSYAVALLALSSTMRHDSRWKDYPWFTFTLGLVSFVGVSLYGSGIYLNIGPGAMERIFFAADLIWPIIIGLHLTRIRL